MNVNKSNFENLLVWQKALQLSTKIILIAKNFSPSDEYSIGTQIKRSAISVASNIAEGSERSSKKEFAYFLSIASGSLAELKTQIYIMVNINLITTAHGEDLLKDVTEIQKMLNGLKKSVSEKLKAKPTVYHLQSTN